jgi:CelD/BcsL family acetyltransferase involved in cellulose biosynthesis
MTLDTLMAQKSKALVAMGIADLFARPGHREFYLALAVNAGMRNLVHVSRLDVGTTVVAANFGLLFRGSYYHLLASYNDGEISRFGPGTAHLHELIRYAIERDCRVFDFTIGDESYKRDWSDTEVKIYDHVSAATPRGNLAAIPLVAVCRLKRWIKQTPMAWKAAFRLRALMGPLFART